MLWDRGPGPPEGRVVLKLQVQGPGSCGGAWLGGHTQAGVLVTLGPLPLPLRPCPPPSRTEGVRRTASRALAKPGDTPPRAPQRPVRVPEPQHHQAECDQVTPTAWTPKKHWTWRRTVPPRGPTTLPPLCRTPQSAAPTAGDQRPSPGPQPVSSCQGRGLWAGHPWGVARVLGDSWDGRPGAAEGASQTERRGQGCSGLGRGCSEPCPAPPAPLLPCGRSLSPPLCS